MKTRHLLVAAAGTMLAGPVWAAEANVVWWDATCRYFVAQLPEGTEGFGLYEWKEGAALQEGSIIQGEILGGPDVTATDKASGQPLTLVHWGDAKKADVLIRHSPDWCKSKRKRK
ncbi:MAG TPA: hypothetical protein VFA81_00070 [Burkholderiales bacterium]|nr:hypothetical protein [Burkholderiales bacterium]